MTTLTRRYRFSASHRLHVSELSDAENSRLFGKCNNPFGHGHDYVLEVTISGEVDGLTGLIVPVSKLDRLVEESVLRLFSHRNINLDVPYFEGLVATTENVALVISGLLGDAWKAQFAGSDAYLLRIHLQETDRNGFEVRLGAPPQSWRARSRKEKVEVNA